MRAAWLFFFGSLTCFASAADAQSPDPYYQLQCQMAGAYCDRVYGAPPPRESFDELQTRRERERARIEQERAERIAATRLKREREQAERAEQKRQAIAARQAERERQEQRLAEQIAAAPAWIRALRTAWPVPQIVLGGVLLSLAGLAFLGRREFASGPMTGFTILLIVSGICLALTPAASAAEDAVFELFKFALLPAAFILLNALHAVRGWHYLFVAHPVAGVVAPPLRDGNMFPKIRLAEALRPDPAQLFKHPPAYQSRDLAEKAAALREKIEADGTIADAAMRRDRARAQKIAAEAELRAALKQLPWWRRILWRLR